MLIRRCAWHREAHGYTLLHGIASWRGFSVKFTDGVCRQCAARVRVEWHLGRAPSGSSFRLARLVPGRYRYVVLAAGLAAIVAAVLPATALRLPAQLVPARQMAQQPAPVIDAAPPATAAVPPQSAEAEPPRVSRHRPPPPPEAVIVRYRVPRTPVHAPAPPTAPAPTPPQPAERLEPPQPAQVAAAPPVMASVSRARATEDELMRIVRRHSAARLLLSAPEERPRHAGLVVQTP
jgi:hypothetical protein